MHLLLELLDRISGNQTPVKHPNHIQTPLSESYNYRHLRTATNVRAITYISMTVLIRTRENSPHNTTFCASPHFPTLASSSRTKSHPFRSLSPQRGWFLYIGSVPVRQLNWPQSTAVSPRRSHPTRTCCSCWNVSPANGLSA